MKHWIAVISRTHARLAAEFGFLQVCHGKASPLQKTSKGDEVFIYCPRNEMGTGQILQTIEFQCVFKDNHIYQVEQAPHFIPFRKDVIFNKQAQPVVLKEIEGLKLLKKPHWGMLARRGFFEITAYDANKIREAMGIYDG
ncbi:EVE domain-containing protein [Bartonella machadoae]|uniref:EVE domain-containing protein n=1 Tax=Bartonella machadoae TaxID=2893471 RepID=UPI001F4CB8D8|nr:EVE domain-containing protein [Bartonella machadoae]UNE54621.1 EVE domain-containing protein [Bartonella machadoae]